MCAFLISVPLAPMAIVATFATIEMVAGATAAAADLQDGIYLVTQSNNSAVCPQQVQGIRTEGVLRALTVYYGGDCADQGPFQYYCADEETMTVCYAPGFTFVIRDSAHYLWQNKPYDIWAEFELSVPPKSSHRSRACCTSSRDRSKTKSNTQF